MKNHISINTFLILFTIGIATLFGILSFSAIQQEIEETTKINAYFADFENLNQYQKQDTITPNIITYSQLKNFNENDNYLNNKKDISKSVTTYSKSNITNITPKRQDVSNRVTTYSKSNITNTTPKKYDVSSRVTTYSSSKNKKDNYPNNKKNISKSVTTYSKSNITTTLKKHNKTSNSATLNSPLKKEDRKEPKKILKPKKRVIKQKINKTIKKKGKKSIKLQPKEIKKVAKKTAINQTKFQPTKTLHYNKEELNTATNINLIESAPVYPNCQNQITENDKKACLLTNVSQFVLDNFNNSLDKKAGLKKGFHEIRVLFIIDENGKSKTYKVLGKYNPIIKNEIKRIIDNLPRMIPGKSNGKNIPVKYSVKVLFEIK